MRTLFLLVIVAAVSLMSMLPDVNAAPAVQSDSPTAEPCLTGTPPDGAPWVFEAASGYTECIRVEGVTATFSNSYPVQITLSVSGQHEDEYGVPIQVEQWREGDKLFVAIFRPKVRPFRPVPAPYEQAIPLDGSFEAGTYTVRVNNTTVEIAVPDAPPPGEDARPPYDVPPARFERRYALIDNVAVALEYGYPRGVTLHVTGYYPYGCRLPLQIEQYREGRHITVEIYSVADPDMICPQMLIPLNEFITLEGVFERGTYQVRVNDYVTEISLPEVPPPPPPQPYRSYAVVEYVEVLSSDDYHYPPRLTLHVRGYQPTGCQGLLNIEQSRRGNRVTVEIYTLQDPAVLCPEMLIRLDEYIPLQGRFEYGTYIIQVNDYTFRYSLPPMYEGPLPPPVPYPAGETSK